MVNITTMLATATLITGLSIGTLYVNLPTEEKPLPKVAKVEIRIQSDRLLEKYA